MFKEQEMHFANLHNLLMWADKLVMCSSIISFLYPLSQIMESIISIETKTTNGNTDFFLKDGTIMKQSMLHIKLIWENYLYFHLDYSPTPYTKTQIWVKYFRTSMVYKQWLMFCRPLLLCCELIYISNRMIPTKELEMIF